MPDRTFLENIRIFLDALKFAEASLTIGVSAVIGFATGLGVSATALTWKGKAKRIPALGIGLALAASASAVVFAAAVKTFESFGWVRVQDDSVLIFGPVMVSMLTVALIMLSHKVSKFHMKSLRIGSAQIEFYEEKQRGDTPFDGKDQRNP